MINWHRLFGLTLEDLFTGSGYKVIVEKDLARKRQLLDVVIIEHDSDRPLPSLLPDGLDNLAAHNLLTYKSLREPLDAWALDELTGHYVNYRKLLAGPDEQKLPPEANFHLYAVATRYPAKLAAQVLLEPLSEGVYEVQWGFRKIRLLVPGKMPDSATNAMWDMFSANGERVWRGETRYTWRIPARGHIVITALNSLYRKENMGMPYTGEDLIREDRESWLHSLPPEELRNLLQPEELRNLLQPEELRSLLQPEELLKVLPPELLKALPEAEVQAWLARQKMETKQ